MTAPVFVSCAKWMATGLAIGAFFAVAWWWLLEPLSEGEAVGELTIPAGTAAAVAAGQPAPFIPDKLVLAGGGELRVNNRDVVDHSVGGFVVPAGAVAVIKPEVDSNRLSCTIHPSGSLGIGPASRPSLGVTVLLAVMIGVPVGLVCWLVSMIGGRLDMDPGAASGSTS